MMVCTFCDREYEVTNGISKCLCGRHAYCIDHGREFDPKYDRRKNRRPHCPVCAAEARDDALLDMRKDARAG